MEEPARSDDAGMRSTEAWLDLCARRIAETVREVEAVLVAGANVEDLLARPDTEEVLGPTLTGRYRKLAGYKIRHAGDFRASWIDKLVGDFHYTLRPPEKVFAAQSASPTWEWRPTVGERPGVPALAVTWADGQATLRADQVLSARRWGIWFEIEDDVLDRCYAEALLVSARHALSSQIHSLSQIEATYLSGRSHLKPVAEWDFAHRGDRFEHLILDILNEEALAARRAELAEDILERTDLRLKSPLIERRQGARVQVSLVVDAERQARKINALRFPDELVILTPSTLAEIIVTRPGTAAFAFFAWENLLSALGIAPTEDLLVAQHLHELFVASFTLATNHPLGPMFIVPAPVRQLVRVFAETAAVETTISLRSREKSMGRWRGSAANFDGRYRSRR